MSRYENTLFSYFETLRNYIRSQPLLLGGASASGGGTAGPPGGFIGYLPQTRVAYDETEAGQIGFVEEGAVDESGIVVSGSLLDNLNHMRYRISALEGGTLSVYNQGNIVASGVTIIDFNNQLVVTQTASNRVAIDVVPSGTTHSGVYNESLNTQVPASGNHYDVNGTFVANSLKVYYNGVRQGTDFYTVDPDRGGFTTTETLLDTDELWVDYDVEISGALGVGGGGASAFTNLVDTPASYAGYADNVVVVNSVETGLSFSSDFINSTVFASGLANKSDEPHLHNTEYYTKTEMDIIVSGLPYSFTSLNDTESNYIGHGGDVVIVREDENGLTFSTISGGGGGATSFLDLSDAPLTYSGFATYGVVVNQFESALELRDVAFTVEVVSGLATKANTVHTHVEADITDLDHDAVKLQGRNISTNAPTNNQSLVWLSSTNEWTPTTISGTQAGSGVYDTWDVNAPPVTTYVQSDEFDDESLDGKWAEFDVGGTLTVTEANGHLILTAASSGGDDVRGIFQGIPAGDFTIICKTALLAPRTDLGSKLIHAGMALYVDPYNAGAAIVTHGMFYEDDGVDLEVVKWANRTSFTSFYGSAFSELAPTTYYFRVRRTGTTYYFDYSTDGLSWTGVYAGLIAETPAYFGPFINNNQSGYVTASRTEFVRYLPSDVGFDGLTAGRMVAVGGSSAVDHGSLTGLADDDHTQYALLAGRGGGSAVTNVQFGYLSGATSNIQAQINALSTVTVPQQILFTIEGANANTTGIKPLGVRAHTAGTLTEIYVSSNVAPAGSALRINILKNASTIFSGTQYIELGIGATTVSRTTNFVSTAFVKDDKFQFEIVQGDASVSDITIHIRFNVEV